MQKIISFIFLCTLLSGCGSLKSDAENEYLKSRNGHDLVVPNNLSEQNISHFYDLPPQNQNPRVSIKPPTHQG